MVIALAICAHSVPEAAGQAPPTRSAEAAAAAAAHLRSGLVYERGGRLAEAEAAFSKALEDGSDETRHMALRALDRVILARERVEAELQLKLGEVFEDSGRLEEAESAYKRVIESGPPAMRAEGLRRIRRVVQQRASFHETYVVPPAAATLSALVYVLLIGLVVLILRRPVSAIGQRRGRNALTISEFARSSGPLTVGGMFTDVVETMHGRMVLHFQKRTMLRNSALPVLAQSQSAEIADLVARVSPSAVPFLNWVSKRLYQPAYRLSGSIESTTEHVNVLVKLEHSGRTFGCWSRSFPMSGWFAGQQDLVYEILLRLKEYVDGHAS